MPSHRMTGLSVEQLDALVELVDQALERPWQAPTGRRRELSLQEAVFVALVYARHNVTEELLGAFMGVDQSQISRVITMLTPVIELVTAPYVPTEQDATEALDGQVALVDGSLAPCWSWADRRDLWAGKHATTGHNFLVLADLLGRVRFVSDPHPGKDHDMTLVKDEAVARILAAAGDVIADKGFQGSGYITPVKKPAGGDLTWLQHDYNNQISGLRAAVERAVAHIKNWRILHTDYRRPINTWETSFKAVIGIFFFSQTEGFA